MIEKIIGSPGCGKTTELLKEIDILLSNGDSPSDIGFVTFTVAGVNEAKERARSRFGIKEKDLPYFKTLHAFAFSLLGLDRSQVFAGRRVYEFAKASGLHLSYGDNYSFSTQDDKIMFLINLARVKEQTLKETYRQENRSLHVSYRKLLLVAKAYHNFKLANGLFDYTDMLIMAKDCFCPTIKTVIIDEAQDLSKLQWELVAKLTEKSERVIIAGDDKQTIHVYGGADVDHFVNLKCDKFTNLEQSYRVPTQVQSLADKIINRVKVKHDVIWKPRDEEGFVIKRASFNPDIITKDASWMILARNKSILEDYSQKLMRTGELFTINDDLPVTKKVFTAIAEFEGPRQDRKLLEEFIPKQHYDTLIRVPSWDLAFNKLTLAEKRYVKHLLHIHGKASAINYKNAKIKLKTIHSSKGTEADYVILVNAMTKTVADNYQYNKDAELRVLFVAVTRARKGLFIINDCNYENRYEVL